MRNLSITTKCILASMLFLSLTLLPSPSTIHAAPTTSTLRGGIVLNEVLVDPNGSSNNFDTDGNGTPAGEDEFVEIYNLSGSAIDIGGLELWDLGRDRWFTFPAGATLGPGNYAVVVGQVQAGGSLPALTDGSLAFDADFEGGVINNGGDNVVLFDPAAEQYIQVLYNGDTADNPPSDYDGFPNSATRVGAIEDWGHDTDGVSLVRQPAGDASVVLHNSVSPDNASPGGPIIPDAPPPDEIGNCGDAATKIHSIQGSGASSPEAGNEHIIEGVVVGDFQESGQLKGFFLQEEDADRDLDPATSEGIFVYDGGTGADVNPGDVVRVRGTVDEYYGLTRLENVTGMKACPSGPTASPATISLPISDVEDWEYSEGMLVTIPQTLYVTDNYNQGRYGEIHLSVGDRLYNPTNVVAPGAPALALQDLNDRSIIQLDDGSNVQNPKPLPPYIGAGDTLRAGDTVSGVTGVLGYAYSSYEIHPVAPVTFTRANARTAPPSDVGGTLTVASFNVLNYFTTLDTGVDVCGPSGTMECRGADTADEFARQRTKIISALSQINADVVGLMEMENNATAAVQDMVDGLNDALGAGTYAFIDTGTIGMDAIKVAFIYKPGTVTPVGAYAILDSSVDPRFIDTKNRPTLAQTFEENATGETFTVVVNHLKSKGSSCSSIGDPDAGDGQGNCNLTRTQAARALVDWLATDPTGSGDPDFLIIGDLNAYAMEDPVAVIKDAGYANLTEVYVGAKAYSYVYMGQFGYLDHVLANASMADQVTGMTEWHINADEPRALDYNDFNQPALYKPDAWRSSDHDPAVIGLALGGRPEYRVYLPIVVRE